MTAKELGEQPVTGHGDGFGNVFNSLTKREWFAGLAMQGHCSLESLIETDPETIANWSLQVADALLSELAKEVK